MPITLDELNIVLDLINRWRNKNPIYWSKLDTFCWLFNWSYERDIPFADVEHFLTGLTNGSALCYSSYEVFSIYSPKYGLELFEDLNILMTSFYISNRKCPKVIMEMPSLNLENHFCFP